MIFATIALCTLAAEIVGDFSLQIVHVNDVHARFEETDEYGAPCARYAHNERKCYGGFSRVKAAVRQATEEAARNGVRTVLLNGGDNFQGTVYYAMYKWRIVADLVGRMGFDAVALGNHEFYDGIDNLAMYVENLSAPVVCCNLNVTGEKRLQMPNLMPSKVLDVDGERIGVIGYLTPDTAKKAKLDGVRILDEVRCIQDEARRLKADGVKIIIALGHSGYETDVKIAEQVEEISVVVGGHSHTLLYTPKDKPPSVEKPRAEYPKMVRQRSGKMVPVVQAYAYTKYLGRLKVRWNGDGDVVEATGNAELLDDSVGKDLQMEYYVTNWTRRMEKEIRQVIGYTRVFLAKTDFELGRYESNLANLITDAFLDESVRYAQENGFGAWTRASVAIYTNGGIHASLDNGKNDGAITMEDLFNVLPYENEMIEVSVYGSTLKKILEISVSSYDPYAETKYISGFLHFSGMRVTYDLRRPQGERVLSVSVLCTYCSVPSYETLRETNVYNVVTVDFWLDRLKAYEPVREEYITKTVLQVRDIDLLVRYVRKNAIVYPKLDNRIVVTANSASRVCLFWTAIVSSVYSIVAF